MVIRNTVILAILCFINLKAQDSLEIANADRYYEKFFVTDIKSISPSGKHIILFNSNQYGKEEYKIFNTITQHSDTILKGMQYYFLKDDQLVIQDLQRVRFKNLQKKAHTDVEGHFVVRPLQSKNAVLLFSKKDRILAKYDASGKKEWNHSGIELYEMDKNETIVISCSDRRISKTDLLTGQTKSVALDEPIAKLQITDKSIIAFITHKNNIRLKTWNRELEHYKEYRLNVPDQFIYSAGRPSELMLKDDEYLSVPLEIELKNNVKKKDFEPVISYTSDRKSFGSKTTIGIYNVRLLEWQWQPSGDEEDEIQIPLNQKGDYILASRDENLSNSTNPMFNIHLILNYGLKQYDIGKGRPFKNNYHWDASSKTLVFFKDQEWWFYSVKTGLTKTLFKSRGQQMVNERYNGLNDQPIAEVFPTKEKSKIIISGASDLFMVDLQTLKVKPLTNGEKDNKVFRVLKSKGSGFNNDLGHTIDFKDGIILKVQDQTNYHSGFALLDNKLQTVIYGPENYTDLVVNEHCLFAVSQFYQQPLKVTSISQAKPKVIFDNKTLVKEGLGDLQMKLLQYKTGLGSSNVALLYPINYDPSKSYPMVVNIYERKTKDLLYYSIPDLRSTDGFNMMHYVNHGYFVMLPDLQYEVGNVPARMIESLEASVEKVLEEENIDRNNIGIVGMSFGGYEAGLALSNCKLFKTGSVGVMMSNLVSMSLSQTPILSEPNYERIENEQVGMNVSLFDDWARYVDQSPVYHLKNVNVPIMLWTGSLDDNVPPAQIKEYFFGLKRLRKKAVLLEYPLEGHSMDHTKAKQDLSIKTWQWMEHFLKARPAANWITPM